MLPTAWSRRRRSAPIARPRLVATRDPRAAFLSPAGEAPRRRRSRTSPSSTRARRSGSSPRSVWAIVSRSSESWVSRSVSSAAEASAARSSSRRAALGQGQLQLGPQDRQRRSQLVAGVGDEGALVLQRLAEPLEHLVQGRPEARDLVVGRRHRQALVGLGGRDLGRPRRASPRPGAGPPRRRRRRRARRGAARPARRSAAAAARSVSDSSARLGRGADDDDRAADRRRSTGTASRRDSSCRPGSGPRLRKIGPCPAPARSSRGGEQDCCPTVERGVETLPLGVEHLGEALACGRPGSARRSRRPESASLTRAATSLARERRPELIVASSSALKRR